MTEQEALDRFKELAEEERGDLCKTAVEALEKQIPRKPIAWRFRCPHSSESYDEYECPYCGQICVKKPVFQMTTYCWVCGQALDWSD